ncbi:MAG TPA: LysM domain-containing protein [Gaiellaceae bacterium]|nr:LysM domain-containing protein [Gaiellaceae bacterium]
MSRTRRRKPSPGLARYGAPAAFLAGVTIAVLLVHSALQHSTTTTTTVATTTQPRHSTTATTKKQVRQGAKKRFYTVQSGDTFGTIASKVGISVERLQSLNPGVSSNALRVGQKLRIG